MSAYLTEYEIEGWQPVSEIAAHLRWNSRAPFLDILSSWLRAASEEQFVAAVARIRRIAPERATDLVTLVEALSVHSFERVCIAPETLCHTSLLWPLRPAAPSFLHDAVKAELLLQEYQRKPELLVEHGTSIWTAKGDYCLCTEKSAPTGMKCLQPGLFRAMVTDAGIVLDFSSPLLSDLRGVDERLSESAKVETNSRRIQEALARIECFSEQAYNTIAHFVKVIVLRESSSGTSYSSSSHPLHIGRIVLRGVENMTDAALQSALIHEAIHQLISVIELMFPFVCDLEERHLLCSPWSGRKLELRTYLHACFVWYGLTNYWKTTNHELAETEGAAEELSGALQGFLTADPITQVDPYRHMIRIDVLCELAKLRFASRSD